MQKRRKSNQMQLFFMTDEISEAVTQRDVVLFLNVQKFRTRILDSVGKALKFTYSISYYINYCQ